MNKHGEMPWWLVLMILAVLFLAVMSFVSGGIIKKAYNSIKGIQDNTDDSANCLAILDKTQDKDGDGFKDIEINGKKCDYDDTNPSCHTEEGCNPD